MKKFGSSIRYLTVDLIEIFKSSRPEDFVEKRDRYLASEHEPEDSYYYRLDYGRMAKMVDFTITGGRFFCDTRSEGQVFDRFMITGTVPLITSYQVNSLKYCVICSLSRGISSLITTHNISELIFQT